MGRRGMVVTAIVGVLAGLGALTQPRRRALHDVVAVTAVEAAPDDAMALSIAATLTDALTTTLVYSVTGTTFS